MANNFFNSEDGEDQSYPNEKTLDQINDISTYTIKAIWARIFEADPEEEQIDFAELSKMMDTLHKSWWVLSDSTAFREEIERMLLEEYDEEIYEEEEEDEEGF